MPDYKQVPLPHFEHIPTITQTVSKISKGLYKVVVYAEYTCKDSPWIHRKTSGGSTSSDFINNIYNNIEELLQEASNAAFAHIEDCSPSSFEVTDAFIVKLEEQLYQSDDYIYSGAKYSEYKEGTGKTFEKWQDYYLVQRVVNNQVTLRSRNIKRYKEIIKKYEPAINRMTKEQNTYKNYLKLKEKIQKS